MYLVGTCRRRCTEEMYLVVASVVAPLHLGPADSIDHLFHRALLPLGCNGSILQPSSGVIVLLIAHPLSGSPCENRLQDLKNQKRDVDLRQRPLLLLKLPDKLRIYSSIIIYYTAVYSIHYLVTSPNAYNSLFTRDETVD